MSCPLTGHIFDTRENQFQGNYRSNLVFAAKMGEELISGCIVW